MKLLSTASLGIILSVLYLDSNADPVIKQTPKSILIASNVTESNSTALTAQEIELVNSTWATLYADPVKIGVAIMFGYLKKYPVYLNAFKHFADVPIDDLPKNEKFQVHCRYISAGMNKVVLSIDDPEKLKCSLLGIVKGHRDHGKSSVQFEQLHDVVLDVLKEQLGSAYTAEVEKAWTKTINAAFDGAMKVFKEKGI